jgi:hypothetical protein
MPTPAEPTVAERLSAFDKVKAEAQRFADKIKHKNREYRRTRAMAALMVAEAINAPYSEEKLRKSGCGYLRVDGAPRYRDPDLYTLAEEILDRALKRDGTSPPARKKRIRPAPSIADRQREAATRHEKPAVEP